jgi:hypothetical protein
MRAGAIVLALAWIGAAHGQSASPSRSAPAPSSRAAEVDALEPAVDVGAAVREAPARNAGGGETAAPSRAGLAAAAPSKPGLPAPAPSKPSVPAAASKPEVPAAAPNPSASAAASGARATGPAARLDLGTTSITGNQELPKVLYIVPWKRSDLGEVVGRPVNTLLDEVLAPVDPDVFKRHLEYYDELFDAARSGEATPDDK